MASSSTLLKNLNSSESTLPTALIIIGMAGTGKTSFVAALSNTLLKAKKRVYTINLDPAVIHVPYKMNIDIRDTVNYKEVMNQYKLGPNGAIMTSLNLFSTRFDKVLELLDKRAPKLDYILIDTPGQIEVFNWSASGTIILDSISTSYPTVIAYIIDTPRCQKPVTFISNMLYACSVYYKSKLPFFLCYNKIDVSSPQICLDWMQDNDAYQDAVDSLDTYMASLSRSFALVLNEFYCNIETVAVSSSTLEQMNDVLTAIQKGRTLFFKEFVPWLKSQLERIEKNRFNEGQKMMSKFKRDFDNSNSDLESDSDTTPRKEEDSLQNSTYKIKDDLEPALKNMQL